MIEPMRQEDRSEALRVLSQAREDNELDWILIHLARHVLQVQEGFHSTYNLNYAITHAEKMRETYQPTGVGE